MSTDAITSLSLEVDDPNKRTGSINLGTLSSVSDVDTFLSNFNHDNNYTNGDTKLHLGDTIKISDGTYNIWWRIAGFDLENDRKAADDTVYNNGYGIMLYPYWNIVMKGYWNEENTAAGGYKASSANSNVNTIATNMKNNILGTHLVNRNVLLSSSVNSNGEVNGYTWTTAYGTLPSVGQMYGSFYLDNTRYDDGEANYRLPLFNYQYFLEGYSFWFRNIYGKENSNYKAISQPPTTNILEYVQVNYTTNNYQTLLYIR